MSSKIDIWEWITKWFYCVENLRESSFNLEDIVKAAEKLNLNLEISEDRDKLYAVILKELGGFLEADALNREEHKRAMQQIYAACKPLYTGKTPGTAQEGKQ